jgi:hypothetical protein
MNSHILDPALTYAALREHLAAWREVNVSVTPIIPGEPEHALLERDDGARIAYSFNPVCRLRVIEAGQGAEDVAMALPLATEADIGVWLDSPHEREVLRGILAARLQPSGELLERVRGLREHPVGAVARAAQALTTETEQAASAVSAMAAAGAMQLIEQQLRPVLLALAKDQSGALSVALSPRPGDAALAFVPEVAERVAAVYDALWNESPRVEHVPTLGELKLYLAPAGMLTEDNALSNRFPGGYRAVAPLLQPQYVWACWKYLKPGESAGMAYDGLVWLNDHWAWFPKPYRALRDLIDIG